MNLRVYLSAGLSCALLAAAVIGLAGCTTAQEPKIVTQVVEKPVAVSCVPATFPGAPRYATDGDALSKATDAAERFRLLAAAWLQMCLRLSAVEPIIDSCRKH